MSFRLPIHTEAQSIHIIVSRILGCFFMRARCLCATAILSALWSGVKTFLYSSFLRPKLGMALCIACSQVRRDAWNALTMAPMMGFRTVASANDLNGKEGWAGPCDVLAVCWGLYPSASRVATCCAVVHSARGHQPGCPLSDEVFWVCGYCNAIRTAVVLQSFNGGCHIPL